jgi:hypothetical protein
MNAQEMNNLAIALWANTTSSEREVRKAIAQLTIAATLAVRSKRDDALNVDARPDGILVQFYTKDWAGTRWARITDVVE